MDNNVSKNILIIVAHTDDETLGLGGTIVKHVTSGHKVYALSMTNGVGARSNQKNSDMMIRTKAAKNAASILGFTWIDNGEYPDNAIDSIPIISIINFIENTKNHVKPDIIYTHSSADLNIDHRIVSQATLTAFRPQPNETWSEIRAFEIPSSTDYGHRSVTNIFYPNLYIDISTTWKAKLAALKAYDIEMREAPHSRSYDGLENLAKFRGNQVGLKYAESFEVIRKIER